MRHLVGPLIPALLCLLAAPAAAQRRVDRQALHDQPQYVNGRLVLPAWETDWERRARLHKDTEEQISTFRADQPALYGVTAPPLQPVRHYAEYDPVDAVYYAWEEGVWNEFFLGITQALRTHTTAAIHLLHHGQLERDNLEAYIINQTGDASGIVFVDVSTLGAYYTWQTEWPFDRSLESIWTVDYGPYFVEDGAGVLSIVDPRYYFWRVNDDAVPTKLAEALGVNVFRPDLSYEGGNLFSDGQGTCFATGAHVVRNVPHTQAETEDMLFSYYGCEKMLWLWPMHGEGTGHIDMFFKPADATTLIVGEYDAGLDPDNAAVLDYNAAMLAAETNAAGDPFTVLRVPMPDNADGVFRSYTNGIVVNDLVLVPVYSAHDTHEASALAVFEQAFPGRTVVALDSEGIIEWGGAIHCVTRTRPVGAQQQMQGPPAELCGGANRCLTGCGSYTEVGDCLWGTPVWCEDGSMTGEYCALPQQCGYTLDGGYFGCVDPGCGTLPATGECRNPTGVDEIAVTCSADGYPVGERCEPGTQCAILAATGQAGCEVCTSNECAAGEAGCDADGNPWTCGEAVDGDNCLEILTGACAADEQCQGGACVCADQCDASDIGCDADGNPWTCGEAGDGDDCTDRIVGACRDEETCVDGLCECDDQCSPGERGCDADGNAWVCGEADDGDDCTDRVTTACGEGTSCVDAECVATVQPDDGCNCTTGPGPAPEALLMVLLLGLGRLRRRRR